MAIYLMAFATIMLLGLGIKPNRSQIKRKRFIILSFGILIMIAALRRYTVGRDLNAHYYNAFKRIIGMPWSLALTGTNYESGFVAFYKIIGHFTSNPQWMIAIHSIFVIGITGWFIYKNSEDCLMSTFLFITANTWFTDMTMLRQSMAIAMGMVAMEVWKKKNYKIRRYLLYIACVLVATAFHSTGIIILVFPIFEKVPFKRKNIFISIVVVVAAFLLYNKIFSVASGLLSIGKDYEEAYGTTGAVVNMISLYELFLPLLCFGIACWSLVYQRKQKNVEFAKEKEEYWIEDNHIIYLVLMLVICRALRLRINIMGRMAQYFVPFMWILFPKAINALNYYQNRKVIRYTVYSLLTVAFIWIGFQSAQQLYGTVPYTFFWK